MTLKEYQTQALTTAMFPADRGLEYCTLGLVGEVAELLELNKDGDKDVTAELGDNFWYAVVLAHVAGVELPSGEVAELAMSGSEGSGDELVLIAGRIANKAKKVIRDGKPLDHDFIHSAIHEFIAELHSYAYVNNVELDEVLQANLDKLASRKARGVITGSGDHR